MRIAIGSIMHETNTFDLRRTDIGSFETGFEPLYKGKEVLTNLQGSTTVMGGFIAGTAELGLDIVPILHAHARPAGTVTQDTFDYLQSELLRGIASANADGVLLNLHGAMVTDKFEDPESEILRTIRDTIKKKVPIVTVHDLHANISESWLDYADAIIGYKTSPHVDQFERGYEGAQIISRILKGHIRPTMALRKPPILIGGGLMTVVDQPLAMVKPPMHRLVSLGRMMEQEDRVVNVTVAAGFGHADVLRAGMGIIVTTNGDQELAEEKASELEKLAWSLRDGFLPDRVLVPLEEAMKQALAAREGPVVLADQGDNAAGGGPGDGSFILEELKNAGWPSATLLIRDSEAVNIAENAGVGNTIDVQIGGKTDLYHGSAVKVRGLVRAISDGTYVEPVQKIVARMGKTVLIRAGGTDLVVTEFSPLQVSPAPFQSVGIDPFTKKVIVVKSAHAFRNQYERFAKLILEVDTPGITSPNLAHFTFRKVRRPIFPLDTI